ncbi:hypothetical protein HMPREF9075_01762 [Capnocytophaga sp. oral taxon 332 str. F0381]|uniref:DUF4929 family protein n=1 Tax=Capnocytophaga sp. oral taxon 332 TaxID=712213 RepID=UPI0002A203C2|nr:DUF4929 family protein [Capnocytophaga sp. oral taxon 332]EKY08154.1 hypothetical protein HMPREF9075_01762 [Capnocytophaga sp. oral taxon 332 str. F0381]
MKFISNLCAVALTTLSIIGCSKDDNSNEYSGKNQVYITAQGDKTLTIGESNQKIDAKVTLTNPVTQNTNLTLKAVDANGQPSSLITFSQNPITIAKDSKEVAFEVKLSPNAALTKEQRLKITFESAAELVAKEDLNIVVKPTPAIEALTDAQRTLLDGYKAKGIDLYPFIGSIKVKTTVFSSEGGSTQDFATEFTREFNGKSIIGLSSSATTSSAVLKMTDNPMGLTEFLYFLLKKNTIEDTEYFLQYPNYQKVKELINWDKNSQETFNVSLDNIEIKNPVNGISEINFIGNVTKTNESVIKAVPFKMEYTAWDRLKNLAASGNSEAQSILDSDGTSNPQHYVNNDKILTDEYEVGNWKASKGSINFQNKTMSFEFLVYHTLSNGYVQVKVEYTAQ